tara:strand:+ start:1260 stop:3191 length:1932 start_codon:yes stop_codon:yes gene_type:complete
MEKISKIETFTVPFNLEDIKENINLDTTIQSIPSKEQIIKQAFDLHSQGNISEAIKYYQYFINQGFKDHRIFSNYGSIQKELGHLRDAESNYREAIKINPNYAIAHFNLSSILNDLGKSQQAEVSIRKAIELKPDFHEAHSSLGIILRYLGRFQEAEKFFHKAIELKPDFQEAHFNLGIILRFLGRLQEAEKFFQKAIELKPGDANAYAYLGSILLDLDKLEEAELCTRKAIEIKSDCINAHITLGEILFKLDKKEEANISEWDAIKLNPSFSFIQSYRKNAKLINKTAFFIYSLSIFNHFKPILEINPSYFEILVPNHLESKKIAKIRNILNNNTRIRRLSELIKNNLIYESLVSSLGDREYQFVDNTNNLKPKLCAPIIKLAGKKNIRFMYTAGKDKYTILSYWNKYYDGILCYGSYHEEKFKNKHKIATSQMGYPRFDKYFKPGFERNYLIEKFKCDPKKKTIVWLPTWTRLSSIDKYHKVISSLRIDHNIVVRPHPSMEKTDPVSYKKLFSVNFNYVDNDHDNDNVQLYALADLMLFDYGGPMFGALYLNKNLAFLEMNLEAKKHSYLGNLSSEDYLKSFFPKRIASLENLKSICDYCLENPPSENMMKSLREEFFNTNYQGKSAKRAYELLTSDGWLR